ncbi:MAG: TRAP transporter small permease [Candidatus Competibacteraceae bacterium]|nr:TRAP transporter small permease [Candidatus Competibacteraceae bacterium]
MDSFINTIKTLSRIFGVIAVVLLASGILVVCQQVWIRYVLGASTVWQTDFVTYSIVAATFIGSPYVLLQRGHVNVDLLPLYLPHKARVVLALLASVGALAFCLALAWTSYELWHEAWVGGWRTATVWSLPLWIPYLPMAVGMILLCLQYIADILALVTGRDMPFGLEPGERP